MKYLKTYENINDTSKYNVGDYVLCEIHNLDSFPQSKHSKKELKEFLEHNIGIITHISPNTYVRVKYNNLSFFIEQFFTDKTLTFKPNEIIIASPNIEDIKKEYEFRQKLNQYNL